MLGNIHDLMRETAVPKCFGVIRLREMKPTFWGPQGVGKRNTYCFGLMEPHFWGVLRETKSLLFCGSGAEKNSVQTLSSAVSLRKDKYSNIHTLIFVAKT